MLCGCLGDEGCALLVAGLGVVDAVGLEPVGFDVGVDVVGGGAVLLEEGVPGVGVEVVVVGAGWGVGVGGDPEGGVAVEEGEGLLDSLLFVVGV